MHPFAPVGQPLLDQLELLDQALGRLGSHVGLGGVAVGLALGAEQMGEGDVDGRGRDTVLNDCIWKKSKPSLGASSALGKLRAI